MGKDPASCLMMIKKRGTVLFFYTAVTLVTVMRCFSSLKDSMLCKQKIHRNIEVRMFKNPMALLIRVEVF